MEVIRASSAGFCMGVILALQKLDKLVVEWGGKVPIYTLGPIIHNPVVLNEYGEKGVVPVDTADSIPPDAIAVIRAHGIPRQWELRLQQEGVMVIDATCPKVKKAQLLIEKQAEKGQMILLFGEESHPEVRGLLSYAASGAFVFDSLDALKNFAPHQGRMYCLAAQTTQDRRNFDAVEFYLRSLPDCRFTKLQTICNTTRIRQEEAVRIAMEVDLMVVVGGYNSGNTRRLAQVAAAHTPCIHVERSEEVPLDKLEGISRVGLTAGASTPAKVIDEIHHLLRNTSNADGTIPPRQQSPYPLSE